VASGLAPRWAAKQPQDTVPELPDTLQRSYWGRFATQRGASPNAVQLRLFVGASLLAKNSQAPRSLRKHALSLTFFASKLAPTEGDVRLTEWY